LPQWSVGKYGKKLLGDKEIEDALQKLSRLAAEEAHIRGTEILAAVYGLVSNMKSVMDGT
jgi:hypothetical protein